MVLPPYVYQGDWRENKAHFDAIISATPLSCMLYNNPIAYGTDVSPAQLRELADHANLHAMKESSGDVRRVTAVREALGDRLDIFAGMDDMILESIPMGAVGWVAGLVNALPAESVQVFEVARDGRLEEARTLYEWFLPLLRLDTVPKFVQLIKLVQTEVGQGNAVVRPPRLELAGDELAQTLALIRERLANRPAMAVRRARRRGRRHRSRGSQEEIRVVVVRADLRGRSEDSARPRHDVRCDRPHRRSRATGASRGLCVERVARREQRAAVASRDQRAGQVESRARRLAAPASRSDFGSRKKAFASTPRDVSRSRSTGGACARPLRARSASQGYLKIPK